MKNLLMWVPIIGIFTGMTEINKRGNGNNWFTKTSPSICFINSCWLGLSTIFMAFVLLRLF